MSALVTLYNKHIENKKLSSFRLGEHTIYYENVYTIDNMYTLTFTRKQPFANPPTKQLRWNSERLILFINFTFDTEKFTWVQVYNHFMTHFNEFQILKGKKYIHEIFTLDTPTRMFFDLDFKKNVSEKTLDAYIKNLIRKVSLLVCKPLEYIITRNDNGDKSCHILFTNLILSDILQCKILASKFKDDYVDLQPYANNKSLRVLNGIKLTDDREEKTKIFSESNYIIDSDETYLIQPYNNKDVANYNVPNFRDPKAYQLVEDDLKDDALAGIDLSPYGFIVSNRINGTNLFSLSRIQEIECPICHRIHDKTDSNYLVVSNTNVCIKCYRSEGSVTVRSDQFKLFEFLESIKPVNYDYLKNNDSIVYNTYYKPSAQMPETIDGNVLYLVSPCKSSKTKTIHGLLEKNEYNSVCFITTQTKFTRNLSERFKDLGFSCYLDADFNPKHPKIIISLYSLYRLDDINQYDLVIIDEIESLLINFCSVGTLGNKDNRKDNLKKYTQLINNSPMIMLMDAYPSRYCIEHFKTFNKKIHVYMNEYQTHKDDKMIFIENKNLFINAMAKALSRGENVVFASALKTEQTKMMDKVFTALDKKYNIDPNTLESRVYNGDLDKKLMDDSIKNIDSDWHVNLLAYSPSITAGISFEQTNFDKVFYLGYPNSNHISALQSLYRVRDVSTRKYYITFGRSYPVHSQIYNESELRHLSDFNTILDYNIIHDDNFGCEITLANSKSNQLLDISDQYLVNSQKNYYKHLIGQFKYNGSEIKFKSNDYQENKRKVIDLNKVDENDISELFKEIKPDDYYTYMSDSHRSEIEIKPEHYNKLPDIEFEKLHNKVNKTMQEEEIVEINTYLRMFPNFNQEVHPIIKKTPAKYYRYYRTYNKYSKYVNEDLEVFHSFKRNKSDPLSINDEPINRFRVQVVSKFLQRLLIDDTLDYEQLHNSEYTDFKLEELLDALRYIEEEVLKKDKIYVDAFMREFYSSEMLKKKTPMNRLNTWKQIQGVINNMLDGTFNLRTKTRRIGKNNDVNISFTRLVSLF